MSAPVENTWYVLRDGQQYGPFSNRRLRELVQERRIESNDYLWCPGSPDWVPANRVLDLASLAQPESPRLVNKIKLYSPNQVGCAAFFGGPFAAVFVLWSNFRALGKGAAARQTLIWGALFSLVLLLGSPFLPERFPNFAMPIAYTLAARLSADKYQLSKAAIQESEQYAFQSNWNVFAISFAMMIAFMIVIFLWVFALMSYGIINGR
jgi:hypothetical protein